MRTIKIVPLNSAGEKAINLHWKESRKMGLAQKMQFKLMGYEQVLEKDPYALSIRIKNKKFYSNPVFMDLIVGEVQKGMEENGAEEKDYKIQVV